MDKKCNCCEKIKPLSEFYKCSYRKSGNRGDCKECKLFQIAFYRQTNKAERNLYERTSPRGRFNSYRRSAKQRDIKFELTFDQFMKFWKHECFYCLDSIETIGIDRIDNYEGYHMDNIVSCCTNCNRMKLEMSAKSFIEQCRKVVVHLG